ncbi:RDD family protein [Flavobacteriales bacterium]|nr:RDD family protein [Flavobacteriales bacterium]
MIKPFKAFIIDLSILILFIIAILLWLIFSRPSISSHIELQSRIFQDINYLFRAGVFFIYYLIILIYFIVKDLLNISVGKKIYNLTIVDRKTGKEAHWVKKILRNVIALVIPGVIFLEFVMKFITPKARFGDMIFDTEIREISNVQ